jgi:hypothetical protein
VLYTHHSLRTTLLRSLRSPHPSRRAAFPAPLSPRRVFRTSLAAFRTRSAQLRRAALAALRLALDPLDSNALAAPRSPHHALHSPRSTLPRSPRRVRSTLPRWPRRVRSTLTRSPRRARRVPLTVLNTYPLPNHNIHSTTCLASFTPR